MTATKLKVSNLNVKAGEKEMQSYITKRANTFGNVKGIPQNLLKEMVKYSIENANTLNNETLKTINTLFYKMDKKMKNKFVSLYAKELNIDISEEINFVLKFIYDRFEHGELGNCLNFYLEEQEMGCQQSFREYFAESLTDQVMYHIDSMLEDNNYALGDYLTDEEINYYSWLRKYLEYGYGNEYLLGYIYDMQIETEEDIDTVYDGVITFDDFVKLAIKYGKENLY